jgi:hypothetical protein
MAQWLVWDLAKLGPLGNGMRHPVISSMTKFESDVAKSGQGIIII